MKKFKRLTISLDEQLIDRMKETADKMGMSLSRWIRFIADNKIRYFDNNSEKYYHKKTIPQERYENSDPTQYKIKEEAPKKMSDEEVEFRLKATDEQLDELDNNCDGDFDYYKVLNS